MILLLPCCCCNVVIFKETIWHPRSRASNACHSVSHVARQRLWRQISLPFKPWMIISKGYENIFTVDNKSKQVDRFYLALELPCSSSKNVMHNRHLCLSQIQGIDFFGMAFVATCWQVREGIGNRLFWARFNVQVRIRKTKRQSQCEL